MVTIIVPVYNSSEYLSRCVDSILKQTYSDIELLLVDDCSTDNSFEVMQKYAGDDSRVRCFQTLKNSGPSTARNIGLDNARGEWISFVDSDDWLEEQYIERLFEAVIESGAELSVCALINYYVDKKVIEQSFEGKGKMFNGKGKQEIKSVLLGKKTETGSSGIELTGPVCKLYSKELIANNRFPEAVNMCEDVCFVFPCVDKAEKIVYISYPGYHREVRGNSLSFKPDINHGKRRASYVRWMYNYLTDKGYPKSVIDNFLYVNYKDIIYYYMTVGVKKAYKWPVKFIKSYKNSVAVSIDYSQIRDRRIYRSLIEKGFYGPYIVVYGLIRSAEKIKEKIRRK